VKQLSVHEEVVKINLQATDGLFFIFYVIFVVTFLIA
jgi:hypothetical protein